MYGADFEIQKYDTYIVMQFPHHDVYDYETIFRMAEDLQRMNKLKMVIIRFGESATMILDGYDRSLNLDKIGDALNVHTGTIGLPAGQSGE